MTTAPPPDVGLAVPPQTVENSAPSTVLGITINEDDKVDAGQTTGVDTDNKDVTGDGNSSITRFEGDDHPLAKLSNIRKHMLLTVFCVASFVDVCNVTGVAIAAAQILIDIKLGFSQLVWIITAYSLTFSSFLLLAGRLSDLFRVEVIFEVGFVGLGILSLVTSWVTTNKFGFLILRGLAGMFGALTIPSSYHMILHMYPDPLVKERKIAMAGLAAALGNVLGLVLAGIMMLKSYHWFFRLMAIICLTFSVVAFFSLPRMPSVHIDGVPRWRRLDLIGVLLMSVSLCCFILGLTQGPIDGWGSAAFIAPFVISLVLAPLFFLWESWISPKSAVLPATVWKIKNMVMGSIVMLIPLSFYATSQLRYASYWQLIMRWKPIHVAAAILPQGIASLIGGGITQFTPKLLHNPRTVVPTGATLVMVSMVVMYYSDGGHGMDYWRYVFPAFVIGSFGTIIMFMAAAVNIVTYCPPEMGGVAGAWTQVVGQVGASIALAVQGGLEGNNFADWRYNARSFWFEFAAFGAVAVGYVALYQKPSSKAEEHEATRARIAELERKRAEKSGGAPRDEEKAEPETT